MQIDVIIKPFSRPFRRRRMRLFTEFFALTTDTRIIDLGGSPFNWTLIDIRPHLTIINLDCSDHVEGRTTYRRGDVRVLQYPDSSFDIAYSNSVIEHVGDEEDQKAFAREIRRIAPAYFVQTPNRNFFVDPHLLTPFVHFLPRRILQKLLRNFTVWGWIVRPPSDLVDLPYTRLLNVADMQRLFPDAQIRRERFLGMTKSIIAARGAKGTGLQPRSILTKRRIADEP